MAPADATDRRCASTVAFTAARCTAPACFLYGWENTDGCDVSFSDGKVRSGRRGDLHIIGELYFFTGKPNEGTNSSIADMLRAYTEYKTRRGWRFRDPVSGKWSDFMKRGCADTGIWDDTNERGSVAEEFEIPVVIDGVRHPGIRFDRANNGPNSIAIRVDDLSIDARCNGIRVIDRAGTSG